MSKFYGADEDKVAELLASSRGKARAAVVDTSLTHPGAVMRLVTYFLDSGLYSVVYYLAFSLLLGSSFELDIEQLQSNPEMIQAWVENLPWFDMFYVSVATWLFYYVGFVGVFSSTPVKLLFGMKMISSMSGEDVGYLLAFWRTICFAFSFAIILIPIAVVSILLPPVIFLSFAGYIYLAIHPMLDPYKRALHDKFAGTEVVYQ